MKRFALLLLLLSCSGVSAVRRWGYDCMRETDPLERERLVHRIIESADPEAIPVLIDCLEEARRLDKKPERLPGASLLKPLEVGPELWGLYVITDGRDFDADIPKWRRWWIDNRDRLEWIPNDRCFRVRPKK